MSQVLNSLEKVDEKMENLLQIETMLKDKT